MIKRHEINEEQWICNDIVIRISFLYERIKQLTALFYLDEIKKEGNRVTIVNEIRDFHKIKDDMFSLVNLGSNVDGNILSFMKQIELISDYLLISEYKLVEVNFQYARVFKDILLNSVKSVCKNPLGII